MTWTQVSDGVYLVNHLVTQFGFEVPIAQSVWQHMLFIVPIAAAAIVYDTWVGMERKMKIKEELFDSNHTHQAKKAAQ